MTAVVWLALLPPVITWLYASARWRHRAAAQEAEWRRAQAGLLAEIGSLQGEVALARIRTAQVTRDTTGWAEGYKHGCNDMIRAMAALHGRDSVEPRAAEEAPSAK